MKIVLINGGRGATSIIKYLTKNKSYEITSIVNAYDDGKSTGVIRDFFKILGPSDIRKVQSVLLDNQNKNYKIFKKFFDYRFSSNISNYEAKSYLKKILKYENNNILNLNNLDKKNGKKIYKFLNIFYNEMIKIEKKNKLFFNFTDCSITNCLYAGAIIFFKKNTEKAINNISKLFDIKHKVFINSNSLRYLHAIRSNGEILSSESEIVEIRSNKNIEDIYLLKNKVQNSHIKNFNKKDKIKYLESLHSPPKINKNLDTIFKNATHIIFCPGTQHSSLYPTYLTKNFSKYISKSNALKILITNIGADYETPFYQASDYINGALKYLKKNSKIINDLSILDIIFINKSDKKNKNYVKLDSKKLKKIKIKYIIDNFENDKINGQHDPNKIFKYINL